MLKKIFNIILVTLTLTLCNCINYLHVSLPNRAKVSSVDIALMATNYRSKFLKSAREFHTATLLTNGKVLIHAGFNLRALGLWEIL